MGKDGHIPEVGKPLNIQISFAPQIEYNLSPTFGFNTGIWFTLLGKNSEAFAAGFGAILYVF